MSRLLSDPKYQALPQDRKIAVRTHLYDKYVQPYLKGKGVDTNENTKKNWILSDPTGKIPQGSTPTAPRVVSDLSTSEKAGVVASKLSLGGLSAIDSAVNLTERVHRAVSRVFDGEGRFERVGWPREYSEARADVARLRKQDEEYLANHYYQGLGLKVAGSLAEIVGQEGPKLPAYVGVTKAFNLGEGIIAGKSIGSLAGDASPSAQFAYRSLKRAAEGYLMTIATGGSHKEAKEAGEYFAYLGAGGDLAGGSKKFIAKVLGLGGTKAVVDMTKAAASPEAAKTMELFYQPRKLSDYLTKANAEYLNREAKRLGAQSFWLAKPSLKVHVLNEWAKEIEHAAPHVITENPALVKTHVAADLQLERASNPILNEGIQKLEQLTKAKGHDLIAERILSDERQKVLKVDKQAALGQQSKIMRDIIEKMSTLGPGAASSSEAEIRRKLSHVVESNIGLQGRSNQITFAWSVNKYLPKEIRRALVQEMTEIYGPNPKRWDGAANALDKHIYKLIKSGHITPDDLRGVFRSTKLVGEPTKWQQMLDQEIELLKSKKRATR